MSILTDWLDEYGNGEKLGTDTVYARVIPQPGGPDILTITQVTPTPAGPEQTERYLITPDTAETTPGAHRYLSTACWHAQHTTNTDEADQYHAYCRSMVGMAGAKRPGRCKFCPAHCECPCHQQ